MICGSLDVESFRNRAHLSTLNPDRKKVYFDSHGLFFKKIPDFFYKNA